jgi:hypothetical protein
MLAWLPAFLANRFDVDDFVDGFASGGNAKSQ